ncbi:hypothetical protein ACOME3_008916 [Neoechinorhynchus agilis]
MKIVDNENECDIYWSDWPQVNRSISRFSCWKKVNHFTTLRELCRKDWLAVNLSRLAKLFPTEYDFFPKTWRSSLDIRSLNDHLSKFKGQTYIVKPVDSCQGKGIVVTRTPLRFLESGEPRIVQSYISRPKLLDGYKFDLRIYVLVLSYDPLRIYIYNEGLVRLTTVKYKRPTAVNIKDTLMHLTNYAIQKNCDNFVHDPEHGSKRRLTSVMKSLEDEGVDIKDLSSKIDDIIIKTIIAPYDKVIHDYKASFPLHTKASSGCFQLLGFDIILNEKNKPLLLEVNQSPSFATDSPLDIAIKDGLISDTLVLLNARTNKYKLSRLETQWRNKTRLLTTGQKYALLRNDSEFAGKIESIYKSQLEWENNHTGDYRRIYPLDDEQVAFYNNFFEPISSSFEKKSTKKVNCEVEKEAPKFPPMNRRNTITRTKGNFQGYSMFDSKYQYMLKVGLVDKVEDLIADVARRNLLGD